MKLPLRRALLAGYTLLLAVLMLWPGLKLPDVNISRPDIVVHVGVFGLLTLLAIAARLSGDPLLSGRNIATGGLLALAYASLTEAAQGMPFINRTSGWDDAMANALGVAGAVSLCLLLGAIDDPARSGRA